MKAKVVVSSCLNGIPVRYDGAEKGHEWVISELPKLVDIITVCPEVEAGLSVPRPRVQLVQVDHSLQALGVEDDQLNVTRQLQAFSETQRKLLADADGYIFKSGSPSCGVYDTPVFDAQKQELGKASGLHAQWVQQQFPELPVIDEIKLSVNEHKAAFMAAVSAHFEKRREQG